MDHYVTGATIKALREKYRMYTHALDGEITDLREISRMI